MQSYSGVQIRSLNLLLGTYEEKVAPYEKLYTVSIPFFKDFPLRNLALPYNEFTIEVVLYKELISPRDFIRDGNIFLKINKQCKNSLGRDVIGELIKFADTEVTLKDFKVKLIYRGNHMNYDDRSLYMSKYIHDKNSKKFPFIKTENNFYKCNIGNKTLSIGGALSNKLPKQIMITSPVEIETVEIKFQGIPFLRYTKTLFDIDKIKNKYATPAKNFGFLYTITFDDEAIVNTHRTIGDEIIITFKEIPIENDYIHVTVFDKNVLIYSRNTIGFLAN